MLREHFYVCEDGHEVRVARPSGDNMEMNVIDDAGSGDSAEVPAEVVALRPVALGEGGEPALREPVDLQRLLVRKVAELTHVPVGGDHQVPRGVRKLVQEHECVLSPGDDQPLLVAGGGRT